MLPTASAFSLALPHLRQDQASSPAITPQPVLPKVAESMATSTQVLLAQALRDDGSFAPLPFACTRSRGSVSTAHVGPGLRKWHFLEVYIQICPAGGSAGLAGIGHTDLVIA